MPAVQLNDIKKFYGALCVLDGINLAVETRDVVAVIGQSGSGKSTMLRCINGLEPIQGGCIDIAGHTITPGTHNLRGLRKEVGMVFQSYNLFPHLNVAENIMLAPRIVKKMKKEDAWETAQAVLKQVGLADKAGAYPDELSGGQQQRVAIARAIVTGPEVLLADEPTGNLDTHNSQEIMELIARLNRDRRITVLLVTHEPDMAAYAGRVVRFVDGRVESDHRNGEAG